jgi:hypothetical protein
MNNEEKKRLDELEKIQKRNENLKLWRTIVYIIGAIIFAYIMIGM